MRYCVSGGEDYLVVKNLALQVTENEVSRIDGTGLQQDWQVFLIWQCQNMFLKQVFKSHLFKNSAMILP